MIYLIVSQSGGSEAFFDSKAKVLELNDEYYSFADLPDAVQYCNELWKGTTTVQVSSKP